MSALPAFDLAAVVAVCGEDTEAIEEILRTFTKTLHTDARRLTAAVSRNDRGEIELVAHRIHGAATAVGGGQLAAICAALEAAARRGDGATIARAMTDLPTIIAEIDRLIGQTFRD